MSPLFVILFASLFWLAPTLSAVAQIDTAAVDTARAHTGINAANGPEEFTMTKSPTTAILFSIIPGGGQIYNQQYWKAPLFAGAAGFFIYRVIYYHNLFSDKADEADRAGQQNPNYSRLKLQRENYRDNRDLNAAYFLGVEILGMIDAYVGAHLFDFNVDDDVSSRIYLDPMNTAVGFSIRW